MDQDYNSKVPKGTDKLTAEKIVRLLTEKEKYDKRLKDLYRNFRGVIHEDSSSEMKYTTIKVLEAHVHSINDELKTLGLTDEDLRVH